jgi:hypothetical protein
MIRNERVYNFLEEINQMGYFTLKTYLNKFSNEEFIFHKQEFYQLKENVYNIVNKYKYSKILFSFKRINLQTWFTDEEIKILKGE